MELRVSVANLVPRIVERETGEAHFVGILNRKLLYRKGERVYGAIGGAAELTPTGMRLLEARFNARFEKGRDARVFIDDTDLDAAMELFVEREPSFCETDPSREVQEELVMGEYRDMPPILTPLSVFELRYVKSLVQGGDVGVRRGSAYDQDPFSYRYFHMFDMVAPRSTFEQFEQHPAVKFFTEEDLATTQLGLVRGESADGSIIGTNLFW